MLGKKLLLVLVAILMLALVACGGTAEAPTVEEAAPAEEEAAPVEEEPMEEPEEEAMEEPEEEAMEEPEEEAMEEPEEEVAEAPAVEELTIFWAQWDPADYLAELVKDYEAETGVKVNVIQEPWGSFGDVFYTEMAAQGDAYDMVVGDSQWIGTSSLQGHYVDLTDFLNENDLTDSVTEATLTYYGEYPPGSGTYWAYPTEGDANGWAYRQDLFEDPDEMAAFEAEYGYPLAPPETMDQLMDIANFFTRPDEGLYGAAIYTQADYDGLTMGFQNMLFSYGGNWSDENFNPEGVINSPESVAALEFYKELYDCCSPPGMSNAFYNEVNDAFIGGQAAMGMNYFAFFPALSNPEVSDYAEVTGYFVNPAGPGGDQFGSLGGQGMSVINFISDERKQASLDFIKWFAQDDVQAKWAALGGYSCNSAVLASDEFQQIAPFNAAFAETMGMVKDFYNIPIYGELLRVAQDEMGKYVVGGEGTAQEAMDAIAEQHAELMKDAGFLEE
jgi:multiple sugar transport system substrate-binding protein